MDTTVRMPIANKEGTTLDFSFDSHLRDVNTDRIINSYIDRVCGEVAVFDSIGNWRQTGVLDDVAKQLELGIKAGKITKSAAKEQKDALTEGMSRLLSGMLSLNCSELNPMQTWVDRCSWHSSVNLVLQWHMQELVFCISLSQSLDR